VKEFGLLKTPKRLVPNKSLLPKFPKRIKHPKYYNRKMKQLKRGLL